MTREIQKKSKTGLWAGPCAAATSKTDRPQDRTEKNQERIKKEPIPGDRFFLYGFPLLPNLLKIGGRVLAERTDEILRQLLAHIFIAAAAAAIIACFILLPLYHAVQSSLFRRLRFDQ